MKGKTSQRIRRLQDLMINVTLSLLKAYFQNANLVPSAYFRYEKEKEDKEDIKLVGGRGCQNPSFKKNASMFCQSRVCKMFVT